MSTQTMHSLTFDYILTKGAVLMLVLDRDGRITESNAFAREIVGSPLNGTLFRDIIVDFENKIEPAQLAQDPDALHLININTRQRQPQTFYCQFSALDNGLMMILGSMDVAEQEHLRHDILELNREFSNLTRQLQKANHTLEKLNQLKNQFLGMAAHDLRKPVGIVMAYSDFLIEEAADLLSAEHRSFLNTIRSSADFMKRLIDNFLDTSLIDSGRFDLELHDHDLSDLLSNALQMVSLAARKKSTRILVENFSRLPRLNLDGAKIEQVLMNILSNAVEFSPPGSTVNVRISMESHHAIIQVSDQGPGIAESEIQNLFQTYARTSARKTAGERSIGLGLAISRKIMEQHGGQITVKSRLGKGSQFQIMLPIHTDRLPEPCRDC